MTISAPIPPLPTSRAWFRRAPGSRLGYMPRTWQGHVLFNAMALVWLISIASLLIAGAIGSNIWLLLAGFPVLIAGGAVMVIVSKHFSK